MYVLSMTVCVVLHGPDKPGLGQARAQYTGALHVTYELHAACYGWASCGSWRGKQVFTCASTSIAGCKSNARLGYMLHDGQKATGAVDWQVAKLTTTLAILILIAHCFSKSRRGQAWAGVFDIITQTQMQIQIANCRSSTSTRTMRPLVTKPDFAWFLCSCFVN